MYPDIQLVIIEGRGMNRFLRTWSGRFDHREVLSVSDLPDHVAAHRNRVFAWFRDKCDRPWLLTMDDDVVPVPETDEVLRSEADVAAARGWGRTGAEMHPGPQEFSMACVKVHRRVVEGLQPPWFQFVFTPDGVRQEMCECQYFAKKVREAGFRIEKVGKIGHRFPVTVLPGDGEPEFLFDDEAARWAKRLYRGLR